MAPPAIGIDLGTTHSCVAIFQDGQVEIIPNDQGNRTTPSCVAFCDATRRLIGEAAHNQLVVNPTCTIFDVKRLIGRRFSDAKVQEDMKLWPFKVIQGTNDIPKIIVPYDGKIKDFFPEEISSMLLTKMKNTAEAFLGKTVQDAVITVPAYFNDSQRQATKDAGHVAGLNVLQLVNEPTAAAIAYHLNKIYDIDRQTNVLVFDLGGGTFDVSVLTIDGEGKIEVKAVDGDPHLGGQDFNNKMVDHFVNEFSRKHTTTKSIKENLRALERLRVSCEKAKQMLSSTSETTIQIGCLHEGIDFFTRITRAKFEDLNADLFSKCIKMVESCLKDAKMEKTKVDEVVLVGGSTRIPKVKQLLQEFFNGKELCKRIHADEAVAYGAAVLAANLSGDNSDEKVKNLVLLDVIPLSLGVEILGGIMSILVPRNTRIPVKLEKEYVTIKDNQSAALLVVYQGERSRAKKYNWLGKFTVPVPCAASTSGVKLAFEIDSSGILSCYGEDLIDSHKKIIITNDKGRLSKQEIKKMVKDAEKYRCEDVEYLQKVNARNMLETYIYDVKTRRNCSSRWRKWYYKDDLKKLENTIEDATELIDLRKLVDVNEYRKTREELEKLCHFMN